MNSFQCGGDPSSPETLLYLRAIQCHSGGTHIDPTLQDNVLLPNDFAEHIYHVGSSLDTHSIILSGLIPGGKDVKKGRHAVFFTAVNPNVHRPLSREGLRRDEAQDCSVQTQWKIHQNTVCWCELRVALSKGLQFYQTVSHAIILYNTVPAMCIEKVVIRPTAPQRIVRKPNLHYGHQDTTSSDDPFMVTDIKME